MDFSYFNNITNFRPAKPYAEILDNAREISQYIDRNKGWKVVWFSEHHLS
ncbi:uncharacterized protein METZ01_LOCUS140125, partial [marine metagenome]